MFFCRKRAAPPVTPGESKGVVYQGVVTDEIERLISNNGARGKLRKDGRLKIYQDGNTEMVSAGNYVVVAPSGYIKCYTATQFRQQFGGQDEGSAVETVSQHTDWYSNMKERFGMKNQIINAVSCVITGAASVGVCLAPIDIYVKALVIGVCAFTVVWTTLNAALGKSR